MLKMYINLFFNREDILYKYILTTYSSFKRYQFRSDTERMLLFNFPNLFINQITELFQGMLEGILCRVFSATWQFKKVHI